MSGSRRARLNGEQLRSPEQLRHRLRTLVFTPDRLVVVKGGPAARRAYLDRSVGRLLPARAALPVEYAAALGQRNAALRRVAAGASSLEALEVWTQAVASLGQELVAARLEARLGRDLERGTTGAGPHLHELAITADGRDLRRLGSQGEQRVAVLALVLAEAVALGERGGATPLLLLDDVLSELDEDRRRALVELVSENGQTVVTATAASALPATPAQELAIAGGRVVGEA